MRQPIRGGDAVPGDPPRYTLISSDTHAGADIEGYKPYLASEFHDEFDAWAAIFRDRVDRVRRRSWPTPTTRHPPSAHARSCRRTTGTTTSASSTWTPRASPPRSVPEHRAAVLPVRRRSRLAAPTTAEEYRCGWAGVQAHNRWLVDFCAERPAPGRSRAGVPQRHRRRHRRGAVGEGARACGGVLIPSTTCQLVNLYEPRLIRSGRRARSSTCRCTATRSREPARDAGAGRLRRPRRARDRTLLPARPRAPDLRWGVRALPDLHFVFTETMTGWVAAAPALEARRSCIGGRSGRRAYPFFAPVVEAVEP